VSVIDDLEQLGVHERFAHHMKRYFFSQVQLGDLIQGGPGQLDVHEPPLARHPSVGAEGAGKIAQVRQFQMNPFELSRQPGRCGRLRGNVAFLVHSAPLRVWKGFQVTAGNSSPEFRGCAGPVCQRPRHFHRQPYTFRVRPFKPFRPVRSKTEPKKEKTRNFFQVLAFIGGDGYGVDAIPGKKVNSKRPCLP
jgi:hypothetical protein